jgi:hypothetical protein
MGIGLSMLAINCGAFGLHRMASSRRHCATSDGTRTAAEQLSRAET